MAMQMRHYEEGEDGVTLHFDRDQPPVHAKVLVGADGYFSKVRTQCLNDGPPTFNVSIPLQGLTNVDWLIVPLQTSHELHHFQCQIRFLRHSISHVRVISWAATAAED